MKRIVILVFGSLLCAVLAFGQTAPAPSALFSVGTQAIGLRLAGVSNPGTDVYAQYLLTNKIIVRTDTLLVPGNNFQGYYGGVGAAFSPDKLFAKTNLPKNSFQAYGFLSGGVVRNVPASGPTIQRPSIWLHGGLNYDPTGSGKFTVNVIDAGWVNAAGFSTPNAAGVPVSAPNGWTLSVGIKLGLWTRQ